MTTAARTFDLRNPVHLLACGLGAGLARRAPGTFGTLVGIPVHLAIAPLPWVARAWAIVVLALAGVWICGRAARDLGVHDHPGIVWDEIVGYLVTMLAAPPGWLWLALGFALFRLFDIVKPWPIHLLDRHVHGGIGIMVDDLLAGGYAAGCLWLTRLVASGGG